MPIPPRAKGSSPPVRSKGTRHSGDDLRYSHPSTTVARDAGMALERSSGSYTANGVSDRRRRLTSQDKNSAQGGSWEKYPSQDRYFGNFSRDSRNFASRLRPAGSGLFRVIPRPRGTLAAHEGGVVHLALSLRERYKSCVLIFFDRRLEPCPRRPQVRLRPCFVSRAEGRSGPVTWRLRASRVLT